MARPARSVVDRIEELGLELTHERPDDYPNEHMMWMPRSREVVVIGYLVQDCNCDDPISSCDGMGEFVTKHDANDFLSHVGRHNDGEPDLNKFVEIIDRLRGQPGDDAYTEENMKAALQMWEEAYAQGKVGSQYAHGVIERHQGSGYMEPYDSRTVPVAVWLPDASLLEHINASPVDQRAHEADKCFGSALDEFNKWAEGDCYGVVVEEFRRVGPREYEYKDDDSCWGYVGFEWALEELKGEFKAHVKHLKEQIILKNRQKKFHIM